ncbi:MAG: pentapeptide repeat-containing protein [Thermomicrobiales bacterium]
MHRVRTLYRANRRSTIVAGIFILLVLIVTIIRLALPTTGTSRLWNFQNYIAPSTAIERAATLQTELQATAILVDAIGALLLIFTIFTAYRSISQTQETLKISQEQLRVAQESQITDRFTKAIEQLGSEKLAIRLGGIYALERIAKDSPRDHWTVMEVLTAFVRSNALLELELTETSEAPKPAHDIQAILTVIARRNARQDGGPSQRIDLSETYLRGANLLDVDLAGAELIGANLTGADLIGANLTGADLVDTNLTGADLIGANLTGAYLVGANLTGADLFYCNLSSVDLTHAIGITEEQFAQAITDEDTTPPTFVVPEVEE